MKKVINKITGNVEFEFSGKMIAPLSETTLQNSNGKNFKLATIEFVDVNGVIQKASAMIYEGNYSKGVEVGKEYLCVARKSDGKIYIQMSHLIAGAGFASEDMFDAFDSETPKSAPQVVAVHPKELAS